MPATNINPINIDRDRLNSKINNEIIYLEIDLNSLNDLSEDLITKHRKHSKDHTFIKYSPVSEFPSSCRDLSFSIKNIDKYYEIQKYLLAYKSNLIKEIFIFDFYNNKNNDEIKLGFRFVFQSKDRTLNDIEIDQEMNKIISLCLKNGFCVDPRFVKFNNSL